jgi:hypothetical protein
MQATLLWLLRVENVCLHVPQWNTSPDFLADFLLAIMTFSMGRRCVSDVSMVNDRVKNI